MSETGGRVLSRALVLGGMGSRLAGTFPPPGRRLSKGGCLRCPYCWQRVRPGSSSTVWVKSSVEQAGFADHQIKDGNAVDDGAIAANLTFGGAEHAVEPFGVVITERSPAILGTAARFPKRGPLPNPEKHRAAGRLKPARGPFPA